MTKIELTDLPGINSLYPNSLDEELVLKFLLDEGAEDFPDKIIVLVSAVNIKRNLYLFEQIRDLNIPMVLAINMIDLSSKRGISIDTQKMSEKLGVKVIGISAKSASGIDILLDEIIKEQSIEQRDPSYIETQNRDLLHQFTKIQHPDNEYKSFLN